MLLAWGGGSCLNSHVKGFRGSFQNQSAKYILFCLSVQIPSKSISTCSPVGQLKVTIAATQSYMGTGC